MVMAQIFFGCILELAKHNWLPYLPNQFYI